MVYQGTNYNGVEEDPSLVTRRNKNKTPETAKNNKKKKKATCPTDARSIIAA